MKRVHLYSIPGLCPLCDEARELLQSLKVVFEETDIRTDIALLRAYRNEIPVVCVDNTKQFTGHIDPKRLFQLLKKAPDRI